MNIVNNMKGKTALITGASSGIGFSIARKLASLGCNLILLSRSEGQIKALYQAKRQGEIEGDICWKECDIANHSIVGEIIDNLPKEGKKVDILINNAGIAVGAPNSFWEQPLAEIHKMISTNILGLVNVTHAVLNTFLIPANRGTVLNVSSVTGLEVPKKEMGEVIYHSTKSFMEAFTNALRNETIGTDIRVLTLRPGFVRTHFHYQRVGKNERKFEEVFEGLEALGGEDLAEAAAWMLGQPERISIKAMDMVPTAQRSLSAVDREWNRRRGPK